MVNVYSVKKELEQRIADNDQFHVFPGETVEHRALEAIKQNERFLLKQSKELHIAVEMLRGAGGSYYDFYKRLIGG